jgi:acyl carrier protein
MMHSTDSRQLVAGEIQRVCASVLRVPENHVTPSARFVEDLDADSLFLVQLSIGVEEHFGIVVPESSLPDVKTVQDLIDHVTDLLEARTCRGAS